MVCIYCGGQTRVVNSRPQARSNRVWRRRRCLACAAVFSTEEAVRHELAWRVRNGKHLQPFLRDKLFLSLYESCRHRKTALSDADGLTETVIKKLQGYTANGTVSPHDIARVAQVALNRFDRAAGVQYQAFHGVKR